MDKEREERGYAEWNDGLIVYHHQAKEDECEISRTLVNLWKKALPEAKRQSPDLNLYTHVIHVWDDKDRILFVFGYREEGRYWVEVRDKDFDLMVAKAVIQADKEEHNAFLLLAQNWSEFESTLNDSVTIMSGFGYPKKIPIFDLADWQYHYNGTHAYTVPGNPIVRVDLGTLMYDDKGYRRNEELEIVHEPGADLWASADMAMVELKGIKRYERPEPDLIPVFRTDYARQLKYLDEKHKAAGDFDFMKRVERIRRGPSLYTEEELREMHDGDYADGDPDMPAGGFMR